MTVPNREETQQANTTMRDYARILFKRKWIILFVWLAATLSGYFALKDQQQFYVSTSRAIIQETADFSQYIEDEYKKLVKPDFGAEIATWSSPVGAGFVVDWLRENNEIQELISLWFGEQTKVSEEVALDVLKSTLNKHVKIEGKGTINFTATYTDPRVAQILANAYCLAFKDYYKESFENAYLKTVKVYDQDIADAKLKAASSQSAMDAFLLVNTPPNVEVLEAQLENTRNLIQQTESGIALINARASRAKQEVNAFKAALERGDPSRIVQFLDASSDIYGLALTVQSTLRAIADLKARGITDSHPLMTRQVAKRDTDTAELKRQLGVLLQDEAALDAASFRYSGLRKELDEASAALTKAESDLETLNKTRGDLATQVAEARQQRMAFDQQVVAFENPIKVAQGQIAFREQKKDEVRAAYNAQGDFVGVKILEEGRFPPKPINGDWRTQVLFISIAGIILGLLAAFALDMMDHSYHSSEMVERELGLPVLATFQEEKKS